MLENKTRLLLILSQDLLDQARVIAGDRHRSRLVDHEVRGNDAAPAPDAVVVAGTGAGVRAGA